MAKMSARRIATESKPGYHRDTGDNAAVGLYLQVTEKAGGAGVSRSWIYRYVSPTTTKARWMGLGPADAIGLADARDLAKEARRHVKLGRDPIEEREAKRVQVKLEAARRVTFGECVDQYLAAHSGGWRNSKHAAQWRTTLKKDAALLSPLPVSEIDTTLVLKVLQPIWTEKPETASRLRGRIERVLAYATVSKYREGDNPARWRGHLKEMLPAISKVRTVKHHGALPYSEIPAFMGNLRQRDNISARALEFAVLTAARTGEVIHARWDEVDFAAKTWTVPATRMKAGKVHKVPLSDRALEILRSLPREGEFIFPGAKAGQPLSNMAMLELVRGILSNGYTTHGMRSAFTDWAHELTAAPKVVVDAALAHTIGDKVEAAYRRGDLFQKRAKLMSDWARYCAEKPREHADNVTALRAGA